MRPFLFQQLGAIWLVESEPASDFRFEAGKERAKEDKELDAFGELIELKLVDLKAWPAEEADGVGNSDVRSWIL